MQYEIIAIRNVNGRHELLNLAAAVSGNLSTTFSNPTEALAAADAWTEESREFSTTLYRFLVVLSRTEEESQIFPNLKTHG